MASTKNERKPTEAQRVKKNNNNNTQVYYPIGPILRIETNIHLLWLAVFDDLLQLRRSNG